MGAGPAGDPGAGAAPAEPVENETGGAGDDGAPASDPAAAAGSPARDDGRDGKGRFAKKDGVEDPEADPKKGKEPPLKFKRKVQVKFKDKDGKETVQEDEVDEDRLAQSYQVERGLRMKAQEWATEREQLNGQLQAMQQAIQRGVREDSRHFLPQDVNPIEYHSQQLEKLLAEHAQDPKDRQIAQLRGQLEETSRKEQEREQQAQEAGERREAARIVEHIGSKVIPLVEQAGLPRNDLALERAVKHFYSARRQGIDDPDPAIIAEEVVSEIAQTMESVAAKMDGEKLLKLFPGASKKIAEALRARYQKARTVAAAPTPKKTEEERAKARGTPDPAKNGAPRQLLNDREMDKRLGIPR